MYRFKIQNKPYRNIVKVVRTGDRRPVAILSFEICAATGHTMVHLPHLDPTLPMGHIRLIWRHLAGQLPFSTYIAYIDDRLDIQQLATELNFEKSGDYWRYVVTRHQN